MPLPVSAKLSKIVRPPPLGGSGGKTLPTGIHEDRCPRGVCLDKVAGRIRITAGLSRPPDGQDRGFRGRNMVEMIGIEPTTSAVQRRRSPN